ncbi:hypothetical protein KYE_13010 [Marinobacter manganoxydans MnI7-9]|jgi:hypothetical protein|uniref:DUF4136 domain-containing protein n=2 Tax=Marinobacteraceae TaxID=2887365 RepID=G6YUY3_9GAMM|nr:lipoprotein [Marinobacter sp. CP1]EHJ04108.1 hypothetical protein KYE_13010 [Marinobacter manganoxydans MnI7-9]MCP4062435.1 DUF4136 domain-containing protein [Gammaproteobacteria bacterium]|tara:strand:- start:1984 stop:2514 length:531 start_codon:yes stop_codon:yes gene_type:complete
MMRFLMLAVVALAMTGCASNVVTDYNSSVVFGNYASWAFAGGTDSSSFTSLDGTRVRSAVERELNRKALKQVPEAEADLLVSWQIVPEERLEQTGLGLGFGFGSGNFGWALSAPPPVREIEEGKLVVELADSKSKEVVWRAASRRYLNENQSPETRRELIDEVVAEMFTKYPPGLD